MGYVTWILVILNSSVVWGVSLVEYEILFLIISPTLNFQESVIFRPFYKDKDEDKRSFLVTGKFNFCLWLYILYWMIKYDGSNFLQCML